MEQDVHTSFTDASDHPKMDEQTRGISPARQGDRHPTGAL